MADTRHRHEMRLPSRMDLPDAVVAAFREMFSSMVQEAIPVGGTVVGREGRDGRGNVQVQMDDEEGDIRTFPRQRGVDHRPGDRVMVGKNRAGEEVITSNVASGVDEAAVNNDQMFTNAVDGRVLKGNSVTKDHIQANAVTKDQLASDAVLSGNIKNGELKNDHLSSSANIEKGKFSGDVQNSLKNADSAVQKSDLADYAKTSDIPDTSDFAKSKDLDPIKSDITTLKRAMKRCKC